MALIPSESLNFPDSFRANVGWRLPKDDIPSGPGSPQPMPVATEEVKETSKETEPVPPSEPTADESVEVVAEVANSSEPSPVKVEPGDPQLELIPKAAEEIASAAPALSVSGNAAQALIAQLFQAQPAVEAPAESVRPAPNAPVEISVPTAGISEQKPLSSPNEKASTPATETPKAVAPQAQKRTERKAEFSIKNLPSDVVSESPAAEIPRPAPPRSINEPADTPKPVVVESPAQANHVLELIAAAVQRGALVGGPVAESSPPVTPSEDEAPAQEKSPTSVPEASESASSATSAASATPSVAKTPAKIRITPRKIKPRASIAAAEPPPSAPAVPETVAPPDYTLPNFPPSSSMLSALAPVPPPAPESPKLAREPRAPRPTVQPWEGRMPPRRITAGGFETESDSGLFPAPERRNRWIGFGLSEAAALTSLILLGRFALIHKFPDPTLKLLVFILVLAAAAIAVAIPIAFIRNNPTRWQR